MRNVILALVCLPLVGCGKFVYSEGNRAGTVIKFSHKGIFCKTWEGELLMGGMKQNEDKSLQANVFEFSVTDQEIVAKVNEALENGKRVALTYEQVVLPWVCSQDTSYRITGVSYK